jgi:hypothetical protein
MQRKYEQNKADNFGGMEASFEDGMGRMRGMGQNGGTFQTIAGGGSGMGSMGMRSTG